MNDKPIFDIGPVVGDDGVDIGVHNPGAADQSERPLQPVREREQFASGRKRGFLLAGSAVAIALLLLAAVPFLTGGDDQGGDDQGGDDQGTEAVQDAVEDPQAQASEPNSAGADTDPVIANGGFKPPSEPHLRADEVASLFGSRIDRDDVQYGIAYVANDDFVVLDHRGISIPELEIAQDFDTVSNLALLTNDGRTWAINPQDRERSYLVSNGYVVVVSERPGTIAVIRPENQTEIGLLSSALPVPSVPLPDGVELLWVQGRGPLVMPRTGGTFEVSGLASSLERISDDRAVAASAQGTVYESCDDLLACSYFSQTGEEPLVALGSYASGTTFIVSPDGASILITDADSTSLLDVASGTELMAFEADPTAVDWAPDSTFVAIVQSRDLTIFYPATSETVTMQLNQVPDLDSLLVFAS